MNEIKPTLEEDTKPHLVWLGKFLGLDVYMDVQPVANSEKHTKLARRMFKAFAEDKN